MIPSVLSSQVQKGVEDFLKTTFPVSTPFFHGVMERFLGEGGGIFKGPYLSIKLPYRASTIGKDFFPGIPLRYEPYYHYEKAFLRLSGEKPAATIIATGTGSGKTECFLYPILDYCLRHRGEPGIKAIIIYPMNALATDQAKRIARLIHDNPNLKNQIKAGLYIGQQGEHYSLKCTLYPIFRLISLHVINSSIICCKPIREWYAFLRHSPKRVRKMLSCARGENYFLRNPIMV